MNETKAVYGTCPTEDSRYFYGTWHSMNKLNGSQPVASSYVQSRTRTDENGQAAISIFVAAHDVTRQQMLTSFVSTYHQCVLDYALMAKEIEIHLARLMSEDAEAYQDAAQSADEAA